MSKSGSLVDVEVIKLDALDSRLLPGLFDALMAVPFGSDRRRYEVIIRKDRELVASMGCYWVSEFYSAKLMKVEEEAGNPRKLLVKFARSHTIECEFPDDNLSTVRLRIR